jgi:transposase
MEPISLTDEQSQALHDLHHDGRNHEERWRAKVILDRAKGLSRGAVAERNGCSVSGVDKCLIRFREAGVDGLRSTRFGPRKRKLDAAGFELLDFVIRQTPRAVFPGEDEFDCSLWTLDLLVQTLRRLVGVEVTDDTVRRYLLLLGWRTRSPKLTCKSPDPEYSAKMVAISQLRGAVEKGGSARRSSCTTTKRS